MAKSISNAHPESDNSHQKDKEALVLPLVPTPATASSWGLGYPVAQRRSRGSRAGSLPAFLWSGTPAQESRSAGGPRPAGAAQPSANQSSSSFAQRTFYCHQADGDSLLMKQVFMPTRSRWLTQRALVVSSAAKRSMLCVMTACAPGDQRPMSKKPWIMPAPSISSACPPAARSASA